MGALDKRRQWNWCHKCRQEVDCDDVHDGSVVRCWGCRRELTVVEFAHGFELFSPYQMRARSR